MSAIEMSQPFAERDFATARPRQKAVVVRSILSVEDRCLPPPVMRATFDMVDGVYQNEIRFSGHKFGFCNKSSPVEKIL
jgi:hypothetical protein